MPGYSAVKLGLPYRMLKLSDHAILLNLCCTIDFYALDGVIA